jgi:hypothetical protein
MKQRINIVRIAGGIIDDNQQLWCNAIVLEDKAEQTVDGNQFASGQKHAKVSVNTQNNNELGRLISSSCLLPAIIEVDISSSVKKGMMVMEITGFTAPNVKI